MEFKPDNFDKEFSLNKKKKKTNKNSRGKMPSWLMILAGAAVIGGVIAAQQPALHTASNTVTSVNVSTSQPVSVEPALFTGINDEKLDSSELEARFLSQGSQMNSQYIQPVFSDGTIQGVDMELAPLPVDENGAADTQKKANDNSSVYWIDGAPYSVKIQSEGTEQSIAKDEKASEYYWLNDRAYEVHLEPVSEPKIQAMPETEAEKIVQIGGQSYLMDMSPVIPASENTEPETKGPDQTEEASAPVIVEEQTAEPTPTIPATPVTEGSDTVTEPDQADTGKEETNASDSSAIVWLNDRAYTVTIKPQEEESTATTNTAVQPVETAETDTREENEASDTATEVPTPTEAPKQDAQTSVFTVEGKPYELQLTELDPEEDPQNRTEQPIVWLDETPLQVILNTEEASEGTDETAETGSEDRKPIEITLHPLPTDQTTALQQERFGEDYVPSSSVPTTVPTSEPTETPTPVPTATPEDTNWLVSVFNNIFGASPTQTPIPQVTVIPLTPTPTIVQPTATPITIIIMPTAAAQGPVRLDITEISAPTASDTQAKDGDLDDPALWEEDEQTASENDEPTPTNTPYKTPSSEKVDAVVVESFETPTVQPTPEELPHTGMAEGWNIPSMLGLLAGLLLVILGVRRLRSKN
ncbi:MAG: LPXTG cell wall anchor domain-containing protein [Anaerolineaceae bacterium]|nr:LPXTG cell wall anchor domain-containing protein [Anaerolineaceae bacterium]